MTAEGRIAGSAGRFRDRREAGRALARELAAMEIDAPLVVGLPRGGVPVAYEVARELGAPLDIGLVRKLGAPGHPEYGIGGLGEDGTIVIDREAVRALGIREAQLDAIVAHESAELERRRRAYRGDTAPLDVEGRSVILVDDGLATGVTASAAARVLKARGAARVIVAVPVCPQGTAERLAGHIGELFCLESPARFGGVGAWYDDFTQTSDGEVMELLSAARREGATPGGGGDPPPAAPEGGEVRIPTSNGALLAGSVGLPPGGASGLVVFVHGSGSSRHSPRNVAVARYLEDQGFATLLFDLLTPREAANRSNVFDIELLTERLVDTLHWVCAQQALRDLPVGLFGASTGAAAALRAAAQLPETVAAVISRGGRPDLAGAALAEVTAPTLLIVGGADREVLALNEHAAASLAGPHEVAIVPGAGHLFEEPGALGRVAILAAGWLARHLASFQEPVGR
jgi:predicted phosphoribosyltransferase/dienelactone hydrolase